MQLMANTVLLKRALLCFWSGWFTIAALTNIMDGLKALNHLPDSWPFASGNYTLILETVHLYHLPDWLIACLFLGAILWQSLAAFLFWRSFRHFRGITRGGLAIAYMAFTTGLGLWASFILIDEILIAYQIENAHRQLFTLQLLSLLTVRLLPDEAPEEKRWNG